MALRERARTSEDKEQRRRAILDAARTLFAERGWAGFAMADVAARAGVVEGTLYLYWPTRRSCSCRCSRSCSWQWLDELDGRLDETRAPGQPRRGWRRSCATRCLSYEPLGRLLAVLQTVLEHNVSRDSIVRFKSELVLRMAATGARFERQVPARRRAGRARALALNALLVGLVADGRFGAAGARGAGRCRR